MFARVITLETTDDQHAEGVRLVVEELLPWARESTGFRGLIGLDDRTAGKSLVLTLWVSEESLRASFDAADRLSALGAETTGATRRSIEEYEVTVFDVDA